MHAFLSLGDTNAIEVLEKFSGDWLIILIY